MTTKTIHVAHNDFFAGLLSKAVNENDTILLLPDVLSFGPLIEDKQIVSLLSGRLEFWTKEYSVLKIKRLNQDWLVSCVDKINNAEEVVFYVGYSLDEKLCYIIAHQIFRNLKISLKKFSYIDLSINPKGGVLLTHPGKIVDIDTLSNYRKNIRDIDSQEENCLLKIYNLLFNDDPCALNDFSEQCESLECSDLVDGLKQRYPERIRGLNQLEYKLLTACFESGPKLSYILADMVCNDETIDQCPDIILKEIIKRFASSDLMQPLLELKGDFSGFKFDVRLTEFGKCVLDGKENHTDINGIDSWICGVHLKSNSKSPWSYDQSTRSVCRN